MAVRQLLKGFTDEQLQDMSPGGRLDVGGDFELRPFVYDLNGQGFSKTTKIGARSDIEADAKNVRIGLETMKDLNMISGYAVMTIPVGWRDVDMILAFPTSAEVAEEKQLRKLP